MSDFDEWNKDDSGRLKAWPLLGFSTAMFGNEKGGLRLEVGAPAKPGDPVTALQVALTAAQLRTLSDALNDVADRLDAAAKSAGHA